jgi:ABC-2 type transport system ATP-binding protein
VNAIELDGVTKNFASGLCGPRVDALKSVTLRIPEGEIVGLLGPNGSGKTTLLKIILGLQAPTAGLCRVFGMPSNGVEARRAVGYLPESPELYPFLTGVELVRYFARLGGVPRTGREERIRAAIAEAGMSGASGRRVGTYSRGMKQRIGLAQTLVTDPRLVILDEPTANLDPEGAAAVCEVIRRVRARGGTVLLSSHQLNHIENLCDRVAFLNRGRIVLWGTVNELVPERANGALLVESLPEACRPELRLWLSDRGARLQEGFIPHQGRLERMFFAAAGCAPTDGPATT